MSASGGVPTPVTKTSGSNRFPEFLPDGRHFLYLAREETTGISVGSLDGTPPERLVPGDSNAVYVPPPVAGRVGHLLFLRQATLMAQAFDPDRLHLSGAVFPVAEQVGIITGAGSGQFSASENGMLVYGSSSSVSRELAWMDRTGQQRGSAYPGGDFPDFRLAPDEQRVVFSRFESGNQDIWVGDLQRGVASRLSFDPAQDNMPIWSPDGLRVLWPSNRNGGLYNLYLKSATGAGQEEVFLKLGTATGWATDWSHDGRFILYQVPGAKTGQDLWIAPYAGSKTPGNEQPFPYLQGPFDEQNGAFSPDGRWTAYVSNESGRDEVYEQSFPLSGG